MKQLVQGPDISVYALLFCCIYLYTRDTCAVSVFFHLKSSARLFVRCAHACVLTSITCASNAHPLHRQGKRCQHSRPAKTSPTFLEQITGLDTGEQRQRAHKKSGWQRSAKQGHDVLRNINVGRLVCGKGHKRCKPESQLSLIATLILTRFVAMLDNQMIDMR
jgi:hypothetical protein